MAAHAHATRVALDVACADSRVVLTIRDDGRGFSVDEVERRRREGHVGLSLLEEHAAEVHGRLTVHSTPGEGTTVRLEVPVR